MNYEDVQKLSNAAEGKAKLLENDFLNIFSEQSWRASLSILL